MTDPNRDPRPNFRLTDDEISAIYDKAAAEKKPGGLAVLDASVELYFHHWVLTQRQQHYRGRRQIRMRKGRKS